MTGKVFGKLKVIEKTDKRIQRKIVWKCQCTCGNAVEVLSTNLISGRTTSCGCFIKEKNSEFHLNKWPNIGDYVLDQEILDTKTLTDARGFRFLSVLIKCPLCGKEFWANYNRFRDGLLKSCGCVKRSAGERKIEILLEEAGLKFEREKTFFDCWFKRKEYKCRFDFFVDNRYLIEFDGIQHSEDYKPSGYFTEDEIKKIKERDEYKNNYCKEKQIPLIRIPYYKYSNLNIEDLKLETTQYLI